jgi:hypothetical protein
MFNKLDKLVITYPKITATLLVVFQFVVLMIFCPGWYVLPVSIITWFLLIWIYKLA